MGVQHVPVPEEAGVVGLCGVPFGGVLVVEAVVERAELADADAVVVEEAAGALDLVVGPVRTGGPADRGGPEGLGLGEELLPLFIRPGARQLGDLGLSSWVLLQ